MDFYDASYVFGPTISDVHSVIASLTFHFINFVTQSNYVISGHSKSKLHTSPEE